ncbi:glycoside hydrolase family 3 protein [Algoriphagus halophytocola]|uniref:beta-N-acetylhexosaminidase n=1 Tax=Algoriphagus halophytocola TaxID=2991499 RepID=A0ABY6MKG1_9BACT|nr:MULTISPECIES: glycoside hydrolase family 3 N-terminal domain-containing protein [unclassified Algoriphagus]UZD22689.1 glycoside hydrolase family 3 protein [Algoriphagus sp. TR-M5]WBL43954.1 glycoside hydrolase family 3 protein [Algoriphagus sp. TR-M9]
MKSKLSKSQKIAQCFSPAAFIHDTEENHQKIELLIREQEIGGLTFFHSRHSAAANFEKRAEVLAVSGTLEKMIQLINRFQRIAKVPLLISIDGEYGLAMRIENTPQYPFAITLGALQGKAGNQLAEVGYRMGLDMKAAGIHLNLAPCSDVNTNPNNPVIGYRSFGTNPEKVAEYSMAMYQGMKKAGIAACLKHFPGHGDTQTDSHLGLPVIQKSKSELQKEELLPFQIGIDQGVEMIMVGHLAAPALSHSREIASSISKEIITELLKKEMGFGGIVISDALNMKAVADLFTEPGQLEWEAFHAGNDILCFSDHVQEGIAKIEANASEGEVDAVFEKIWNLKEKLGVFAFKNLEVPVFDWKSHSVFQSQLAKDYVSVLHGNLDPEELKHLADQGKLSHKTFFGRENTTFSSKLSQNYGSELSKTKLEQAEKVIISVFVPSHKPINQFGMDQTLVAELKNLAQAKPCILVHFGNPLALKHLGNFTDFEAVICGYQHFDEAQAMAFHLFQ